MLYVQEGYIIKMERLWELLLIQNWIKVHSSARLNWTDHGMVLSIIVYHITGPNWTEELKGNSPSHLLVDSEGNIHRTSSKSVWT